MQTSCWEVVFFAWVFYKHRTAQAHTQHGIRLKVSQILNATAVVAWGLHKASRDAIAETIQNNYNTAVHRTATDTLGNSFMTAAAKAWRLTNDIARMGGRSKWNRPKTLPILYNAHGRPVTSTAEKAPTKLDNYASIEAATVVDSDQLIATYDANASVDSCTAPSDIRNVPDSTTVTSLYKWANPNKATSDPIPPDDLQQICRATCPSLTPLLDEMRLPSARSVADEGILVAFEGQETRTQQTHPHDIRFQSGGNPFVSTRKSTTIVLDQSPTNCTAPQFTLCKMGVPRVVRAISQW